MRAVPLCGNHHFTAEGCALMGKTTTVKVVVPRGGHLVKQNRGTATAQPTRPAGGRNKCWRGGAGVTSTVASALVLTLTAPPFPEAVTALWDANSTPVCWGCQDSSPTYCRLKP